MLRVSNRSSVFLTSTSPSKSVSLHLVTKDKDGLKQRQAEAASSKPQRGRGFWSKLTPAGQKPISYDNSPKKVYKTEKPEAAAASPGTKQLRSSASAQVHPAAGISPTVQAAATAPVTIAFDPLDALVNGATTK